MDLHLLYTSSELIAITNQARSTACTSLKVVQALRQSLNQLEP